mmetsp:Transcript_15096/g.39215  ORF Transcript_15096/g.39215 Transcript_15096/m.39215 type:complete len:213 (-) Transcript_15096:370-1008(-)
MATAGSVPSAASARSLASAATLPATPLRNVDGLGAPDASRAPAGDAPLGTLPHELLRCILRMPPISLALAPTALPAPAALSTAAALGEKTVVPPPASILCSSSTRAMRSSSSMFLYIPISSSSRRRALSACSCSKMSCLHLWISSLYSASARCRPSILCRASRLSSCFSLSPLSCAACSIVLYMALSSSALALAFASSSIFTLSRMLRASSL